MSSMIEQIRSQGVNVACKWLEVTGNIEPRKRFTLRRQYWLLTVRLRYAEWIGSEVHASDVRNSVAQILLQLDDEYSLRMYQVLEISCYLSLYRISDGRILPLFKPYHRRLLLIIDEFMAIPQDSITHKSFVEDCSRVFDVIGDIEAVCGSRLYKERTVLPVKKEDEHHCARLLPFKPKETQEFDQALTYFKHWVSTGEKETYHTLSVKVLKSVESAKNEIDQRLAIDAGLLFYQGIGGDHTVREKINASRQYMIGELLQYDIHLEKDSFWRLYIELVIQKAANFLGKEYFSDAVNNTVLREMARWPVHEKMHRIINILVGDPKYLKQLLNKKIINSESLLYGVVSSLAVKKTPIVYCRYDRVPSPSKSPTFQLSHQAGEGFKGVNSELVEVIYGVGCHRKSVGFYLNLPNDESADLDIVCICSKKQVVFIGLPKQYTALEKNESFSNSGLLGGLIRLAGYDFSTQECLSINTPTERLQSPCRLQCVEFKACDIQMCSESVNRSIIDTSALERRSVDVVSAKFKQRKGYFSEMISVARGR